jgi:eukaryotic-like serine/threonine-protein kinase
MTHDPENAVRTAESRSSSGRLSRSAVGRVIGRFGQLQVGSVTTRAAGRFFRRHLWVWPIVGAVLLGGAGWWVNRSVEDAMRRQRVTDLNTILDASVNSLRVWLGEQQINVQLFTGDEQLRPLVRELVGLENGTPGSVRQLMQTSAQSSLRARLAERLRLSGYVGFVLVSSGGVIIAADQDAAVGKQLAGERKAIYDRAMEGKTVVSRPFRSSFLLMDENGELRANLPTMFVAGPIRDETGKPIAALGLRIRPEDQFTRILQVARFGESGETYAFDRSGLLLSQSRFDDDLKEIGLLVDQPDSRSILTLQIRDPGVNLVDGERPKVRRADQPLTRMAAAAVEGVNGNDADGYRDYRGAPTVGAWVWLPDYEFGVATEVEKAEAFQPVYILRRAFRVLMGLLIASAVGIFLAMIVIARQQRALQRATLAARQLGQYALEEKLGAGGMGTVYKARHAMLRRPTAVKLLDPDKMSPAAVARFEREVQLTSGLTHPNTVAVFDYGRTPEGIFYYAMEYLDGLNLDDLVTRCGPLPEARVVYLLRQICGSLAEAHASGLVHRDIKPANIFLTRRGGVYDFVKVLDFGLVKAAAGEESASLTNPDAVTGTPLYLSPEAINDPEHVDARADVYAIGAVGYFLLTALPVFSGRTVMEICMKHVKETPEAPSVRAGREVSPELEALVLSCLAKERSGRPADAAELLRTLESCTVQGTWTTADAATWWAAREQTVGETEPGAGGNTPPSVTVPASDLQVTVAYGILKSGK